jgi:hypothetical protein
MTRIEVLFWQGCPSYPAALDDIRQALAVLGGLEAKLDMLDIETEAQAAREGFIGSPTIRIDGVDVVPPPPDAPTSLTCRVYVRRDGRFSPTPDPADLVDALQRSLHPRRPAVSSR